MPDCLITDFCVGLANKNITIPAMTNHLKKVGKSNGYKYFSFIMPRKYLKHISCNYSTNTINIDELEGVYKEIYKDSVYVF
tara:strand:- start:1026 stop:1268 length:243 start_codon:yes stop_codon:yes gene_type:complete